MEDVFDVLNGLRAGDRVANIAFMEINPAKDIREIATETGGEVVEDPNRKAVIEQSPHEMRSNEAGASGHQGTLSRHFFRK
jgi:hypothetical protein